MNDARSSKPERRRYQFSLRTLLLFAAVVSVALSLLKYRDKRVTQQGEVLRELTRRGLVFGRDPRASGWIQYLGGSHKFASVVEARSRSYLDEDDLSTLGRMRNLRQLTVMGPRIADDALRQLRHLDDLESLSLAHTGVRGPGLAYLPVATNLKKLSLSNMSLTDAEHLRRFENLEVLHIRRVHAAGSVLALLEVRRNLKELLLEDVRVDGEALRHLRDLPNLETLSLANVKEIGDKDLAHLAGLKFLQTLRLTGTRIAGPGLEHLKGLTCLKELELDGTQVTDAGLEHLEGLKYLQTLSLADTRITSLGLEHLRGLPCLKGLGLTGTAVTDAGLEHLRGMASLQWVGLYDTQVTDAGLDHLKGLPRLTGLGLDGTQVTDAGLRRLKGMRSLRWLSLYDAQVTDAGVKKLQQALPKCRVSW